MESTLQTAPEMGIEFNEDVLKEHLHPRDESYFAPTNDWNDRCSQDRIYS